MGSPPRLPQAEFEVDLPRPPRADSVPPGSRAPSRAHDAVGNTDPDQGDLDRTATFWRPVGFDVVERHADYLVTHADGVELHFAHDPSQQSYSATGTSSALAFIHVQDAAALWKRLKAARTTGLGPVEDPDHGLREFILTDPDGNRVRFGSAIRT